MTWLIRCLISIMLEWPMELQIAIWFRSSIFPQHGPDAFCPCASVITGLGQWKSSSGLCEAATITLLQDLLYTLQTECQDCSAKADKMKRRSKSFFLKNVLIPYRMAAGSWNDCCCMLKTDPHRAENYFHAPCEVRRLEDSLKKKNHISTIATWEKLHPRCNVTTHPNEICVLKKSLIQRTLQWYLQPS